MMPVEIIEQAAEAGVALSVGIRNIATSEMNMLQADYDNSVLLEGGHANVGK